MVFEVGGLFDFLVLVGPEVLELLVELLLLLLVDVLVGELLLGELGRGGRETGGLGGLTGGRGDDAHHLVWGRVGRHGVGDLGGGVDRVHPWGLPVALLVHYDDLVFSLVASSYSDQTLKR